MEKDENKIARIKNGMQNQGLDALILRLPENVLYASGYWPIIGQSYLIFPLDYEPVLIIHESEKMWADKGWVDNFRFHQWKSLKKVENSLETARNLIKEVFNEYNLTKSKIGYELSFEQISSSAHNSGAIVSYPSTPTYNMYSSCLPKAKLFDITNLLYSLRAIKTDHEITLMKAINEIADYGLEVFYGSVIEGESEYKIGLLVERKVVEKALEYDRFDRARAYAMIQSGRDQTAIAGYPYSFSSKRKIRKGDLVLIELDVCVEGYWADLTRTIVVGRATKQQNRIYNTVLDAQTNAFEALEVGESAFKVDAAARQVIERAGYGQYFHHGLGHGIGVCLHEPLFPPPHSQIHPLSKGRLKTGNVFTMEPGIYFKKFGGIRIEDDILCGKSKGEYLSNSKRQLEI